MGKGPVDPGLEGGERRSFVRAVLADLHALERMIAEGKIECGVRRVGAEQEMFLVEPAFWPAPASLEVLRRLNDPHFTTELGLFNLECNLDPLEFGGDCLSRMERQLVSLLDRVRRAAAEVRAQPVLCGILPTVRKSDLGPEFMTPIPRYRAINEAMTRLRGGAYEFKIDGLDELVVQHDSVMLEACNASFQVHFQVGADEFANLYNVAQAAAGPVLAAATHSPLLFGRRLWRETRIALFRQSVDTRAPSPNLRRRTPRVSFGRDWVHRSVVELYREDIRRFRAILAVPAPEDPFERLDRGETPELTALRLFNGTVYRWTRACYGVTGGKPHLRIENRILPAGPTPLDEMANAAFWFGLIIALAERYPNLREVMKFEDAVGNFEAAARHGLHAQFTWLDGRTYPAREILERYFLPLAREGLLRRGAAEADVGRYLDVLEERVRTGRTGSRWMLDSLAGMDDRGTPSERLRALTAGLAARQWRGEPVSRWIPARLEEAGGWKHNYVRVEQYMTTDLVTVHDDDPVDLVANLMEWEKVRHILVENQDGRLVGLVSYRSLLRLIARGKWPGGEETPPAVSEVMNPNPVTVAPETRTLAAIEIMRNGGYGCLPVVKDGRLVGVVTERDFMDIAGQLLQRKLSG